MPLRLDTAHQFLFLLSYPHMITERSSMTTTPLRTVELTRTVDGVTIVDSISVSVRKTNLLAVVGPSGAGKSSFLRLLNRLDEPTHGTVYVNETDYRNIPPQKLRRQVGLVPQDPALISASVFENVARGPKLRDEPVDETEVGRLLARLGLDGYGDRHVPDLSGGEAQRVSLARTLLNEPDVLLLDEPTSNLDPDSERVVEMLVDELIEDLEICCVMVTHDREQARRLADRVLLLNNGAVSKRGRPSEVLS